LGYSRIETSMIKNNGAKFFLCYLRIVLPRVIENMIKNNKGRIFFDNFSEPLYGSCNIYSSIQLIYYKTFEKVSFK